MSTPRIPGRVFATGALALLGWSAASATVYDLVADWSDVNNPMGQWSLLKAHNTLFTVNQADWLSNGTGLRAWADDPYPAALHVPFWARIDAARAGLMGDSPADSILMHGSDVNRTGTNYTAAVFTNPIAGTASVSGDAWMAAKSLPRGMNWQILKNGSLLTEGTVSHSDGYTSIAPMSLAAGTGGASALNFAVAVGDSIELRMLPSYTSPDNGVPWIAGLHMTVDVTPVPEPASLVGLAAGALALRRRRRYDL